MPSNTYHAPESYLGRSESGLSTGNRRQHHFTCSSVESEPSQRHALIAANIAMERSHGNKSESLSRESSKRSTLVSAPYKAVAAPTELRGPRVSVDREPERPLMQAGYGNESRTLSYIPPAVRPIILASKTGAFGEADGSQPSSYRRLRKAKSTMSTRTFNDKNFGLRVSDTRHSPHRSLQRASSSISLRASSIKLSLRRSFSVLRSHNRRPEKPIPYQPELTCRPESIALARTEFLKLSASPPVQEDIFNTPENGMKGSEKSLRKSVRSGELTPRTKEDLSPRTNKSTRRSLSASFRRKIKRVFGKSTPDQEIIPPQQLGASRQHFVVELGRSDSKDAFDRYCDNDPELSRRHSLYVPSDVDHNASTGDADPFHQIDHTKSTNSLRSSSQSRITSWNNSSLSGSVRGDGYDPKRLSVIREDAGPHQPSSSAGRHVGGISVFQQPLQLGQGAKVDSQRIYSALLKRIDNEEADSQRTGAALTNINENLEDMPQDGGSMATVRRVQSESSFATSRVCSKDADSVKSIEVSHQSQATPFWTYRRTSRRRPPQRRMHEQASVFFGSSSGTPPQTQCPFGKLLRERSNDEVHGMSSSKFAETRSHENAVNPNFVNSVESLYSRTTNGGTNLDYPSPCISTEDIEAYVASDRSSQGMVTLMYSHHAEPDQHAVNLQRGVISEYKASSVGCYPTGEGKSHDKHPARDDCEGKGHVRELTQVDPHDIEMGPSERTTNSASTPCRQPSFSAQQKYGCSRSAAHDFSGSLIAQRKADCSGSIKPLKPDVQEQDKCQVQESCPAKYRDFQKFGSDAKQVNDTKPQPRRKVSTTHIARMLKLRKSQPTLLSNVSTGKENKRSSVLYTTPTKISTKQHFQTQSISASETLRESNRNTMRKASSTWSSPSDPGLDVDETMLKDKTKTVLTARLSRPFDMDVPEFNRPFDSTFLGRSERSSPRATQIARLSVAPRTHPLRAAKSYGGLGIPHLHSIPGEEGSPDPTALPQVFRNDHQETNSSFGTLAFSGKRMVSNFLRSRRKDSGTTKELPETAQSNSPAFV